jgi:hypothetical protein
VYQSPELRLAKGCLAQYYSFRSVRVDTEGSVVPASLYSSMVAEDIHEYR